MTEDKTLLCIGGPLDGQRYSGCSGAASFEYPVPLSSDEANHKSTLASVSHQINYEMVIYRREQWYDGDLHLVIGIWTLDGLDHDDVLRRLPATYRLIKQEEEEVASENN